MIQATPRAERGIGAVDDCGRRTLELEDDRQGRVDPSGPAADDRTGGGEGAHDDDPGWVRAARGGDSLPRGTPSSCRRAIRRPLRSPSAASAPATDRPPSPGDVSVAADGPAFAPPGASVCPSAVAAGLAAASARAEPRAWRIGFDHRIRPPPARSASRSTLYRRGLRHRGAEASGQHRPSARVDGLARFARRVGQAADDPFQQGAVVVRRAFRSPTACPALSRPSPIPSPQRRRHCLSSALTSPGRSVVRRRRAGRPDCRNGEFCCDQRWR